MSSGPQRSGRRGRRPGPTTTPEEIIEAARQCFSDAGYDRTTIRGIARAAKVDPSLVVQQYGSKDALFAAVVADLGNRVEEYLPLLREGGGTLGERLARFYFTAWQAPTTRATFLAVIRSVSSEGRASAVSALLRVFLGEIVPALLAEAPGLDPDAALAPIAGQLLGTAVARFLIEAPFLRNAGTEELVALTAPVLDGILARAGHRPEPQGPA